MIIKKKTGHKRIVALFWPYDTIEIKRNDLVKPFLETVNGATLPQKTTRSGNRIPSTVLAVVVTIFIHVRTFIVIISTHFSTIEQCSKSIVLCKFLHNLLS